jgi:hypothetical protein
VEVAGSIPALPTILLLTFNISYVIIVFIEMRLRDARTAPLGGKRGSQNPRLITDNARSADARTVATVMTCAS